MVLGELVAKIQCGCVFAVMRSKDLPWMCVNCWKMVLGELVTDPFWMCMNCCQMVTKESATEIQYGCV